MQYLKIVVYLGIAVLIGAGSWLAVSRTSDPVPADRDLAGASHGTGPLDGMVFTGALGPDGKPKDTEDTFVFAKGTFVSTECERRCQYPARPYFVRKIGEKTEFISETQCPYKDAKILWRGTVEGDTIKGRSTWTVKRWYWTIENTFEFAGTLSRQSSPAAVSQ